MFRSKLIRTSIVWTCLLAVLGCQEAPEPAPQAEVQALHSGTNYPPPAIHPGNSENLDAATDGQSVVMQANGKWAPETIAGGGASDLADLGDVTNAGDATDGQFLAANGDDTFTFETPSSASEPGVYNVIDYGASGDYRQSTTSGSTAAGTSVVLTAGHGNYWANNHGVLIPFAGAASPFAAVTPTTPVVSNGGTSGATRYDYTIVATDGNGGTSLVSSAGNTTTGNATLSATNYNTVWWPTSRAAGQSVTFTAAASVATATFTQPVYTGQVVRVSSTGTLPAGTSAATDYYARRISATTFGLHASWRDAQAGVNTIALDAGSGTHTMTRHDNANGYYIYGRGTSSRTILTRVSGAPNAYLVTFQAGGYTNAVAADIGRTVRYSSVNRGTLVAFDNTARTWVVQMNWSAWTNYFPSGSAVTISGGTGVGTTTGNALEVHAWTDAGDTVTTTAHRTLSYKASTVYEEGDLVVAGGVWYECHYTHDDRTSHSSAPTFDTDLNDSTSDGGVAVRWRRANQLIPASEPTDTLPQAYRGTVTNVSTDTLTVDPATSSTVASGSMVAHDDTAAFISCFSAIIAAGGGTMLVPGGGEKVYNLYTPKPATGGGIWGQPNSTSNAWCVFGINGGASSLMPFRMKFTDKAAVFWRPCTVDAYLDNSTSNFGAQSLFNVAGCNAFDIDLGEGRLICAPPCGPGGEDEALSNDMQVVTNLNGASVNDFVVSPRIHDGTISGFASIGNFGQAQIQPGKIPQYDRIQARYSMGGGHDAGFGGGNFYRCVIERIRLFGSTGLYSSDQWGSTNPTIIESCTFKRLRTDGVRIRSGGLHMSNCLFVDCEGTNGSGTIILLENSPRTTVVNTRFVRTGTAVRFNGAGVTVTGCVFEDSQLDVACSVGSFTGNTFVITSSFNTQDDRLISLISGAGHITIANNSFNYLSNPTFCDGITVDSGTQISITGNTGRVYDRALAVNIGFVGAASITGNNLYSNDAGGSTNVLFYNAGNGAIVESSDNYWSGSAGTDNYRVGSSASSATYRIKSDRTNLCLNVDVDTSGAVSFGDCFFGSSTAATLAKNGAIYRNCEFAVAPSITGTLLNTQDNTLASALFSTPAALSSGNNNDYALGVTDTHRLDPNASNSAITSIVARAGGARVTIVCVDAGAATLTIVDDDGSNGTATNRIVTPDGNDIVLSNNETVELQYDATSQRWKVVGGGYSVMFDRDIRQAFTAGYALAA